MTFSSLSALQTIHAKDANVFKGDEFYGLLDGGVEAGRIVQMTAENEAHAARRRVLDKAMPTRENAFREINILAQRFVAVAAGQMKSSEAERKGWGKPVDTSVVATWYTFDVISVMAFGESLGMLQSEEHRWVPGCLKETSIFLYWAGYAPGLTFWRWLIGTNLPSLLGMQTVVESQKYADFANSMLDKTASELDAKKKAGSNRPAIFRHLLDSNLYRYADLRSDSSLLIAAGSDAVRLIIAATIFYWFKNPAVFDRATEEIRSSVRSIDDVSDATISALKYLRACIDETMRLCPPKPSSLPREVKQSGIDIDGIHVPAGMTVGTSVYALHHDPEIFPEPYAYRPGRWLQQPIDRRMRGAFCPFLKGPRACPGGTVAYFAMELVLFHLVYRYDIRPAGGVVIAGGHARMPRLKRREDEYQFND